MVKDTITDVKARFGIVGHDDRLNHAIRTAMQVASTEMNVLITGESGTGKESFSKIIHEFSARRHYSFIAINCAAIPEGTIDSELFGHVKGAFTGATDKRSGYFEESDKGTIFLDEISEMPQNTQSRLLRLLENKEFIKVGSSKVEKVDVRLVAASNKELVHKINMGLFRDDLYYRLSTVPIHVPPLRERGEDMLLLFMKFALDCSEKYRSQPIILTPDAEEQLLRHPFPGNIRQLKNLVEQISVLEMDRSIDSKILEGYLQGHETRLPALMPNSQHSSSQMGMTDRDILYKILLDLRSEMGELNEKVKWLQTGQGQEIAEGAGSRPYASSTMDSRTTEGPRVLPLHGIEQDATVVSAKEGEAPDSLSLKEKEKEMISKALKKSANRRGAAAQDLGISERTLYRKIKIYELED